MDLQQQINDLKQKLRALACTVNAGSSSMVYPSAGIPISTGTAWDTSLLDNSTNWNIAYTDRNKWDGGSTGLTASTGRTSLGGTTVGQNLFTATNPSAVRWIKVNADNTITFEDAATTRASIGAGTGTVTGTGASTQLAYFTGSGSLGSNAELTYNPAPTTGDGLYVNNTTLSSGKLVNIISANTAAAGNTQVALNVGLSGANATSTQQTIAGSFSNTHTGTSSSNIGVYASASGGTTNYAISTNGASVYLGGNTSNSVAGDVTIAALHNSTGGGGSGNRLFMCDGSGDFDLMIKNTFKTKFSYATNVQNFSGYTTIANLSSSGFSLGNGTTLPNASAISDITSTTKGVLIPRMTTTQKNAISSPAESLMVYDLTLHKLCVYDGTIWQEAW